MTPNSPIRSFKSHWRWLCVGFVVLNCSGTEGDNPFSGTIDPSPCKGEEEYTNYLQRRAHELNDTPLSYSDDYVTQNQALVERSELPVGLRCLAWHQSDETLNLFVSNFDASCAVGWESSSEFPSPGKLVLRLTNPSCNIAKCGSCFYDTDARFKVTVAELLNTEQDDLELELQLRDCDGKVTKTFSWRVPLRERARGTLCASLGTSAWRAYSDASSVGKYSETQLNLYAPCDSGSSVDVECSDDRSCIEEHCVPPCESDADCPLSGALTCQDSFCQLPQ